MPNQTFPQFIAIDLETTDSNSEKGSVIQIGAVTVGGELEMRDAINQMIKPLDDYHNPQARKVHNITDDELARAPSWREVLPEFERFCTDFAGERPILASWGAYFDIPFLRGYYKRVGRIWPFSRRSIDLKSIALFEAGVHGLGIDYEKGHGVQSFLTAIGLTFHGRPHNAYDDITNTMRILEWFRDNRFPVPDISPEEVMAPRNGRPTRFYRGNSPQASITPNRSRAVPGDIVNPGAIGSLGSTTHDHPVTTLSEQARIMGIPFSPDELVEMPTREAPVMDESLTDAYLRRLTDIARDIDPTPPFDIASTDGDDED